MVTFDVTELKSNELEKQAISFCILKNTKKHYTEDLTKFITDGIELILKKITFSNSIT